MDIYEFKNKINLIIGFIMKLNKECVPINAQRIFIKLYGNSLKLNLTDEMINSIIFVTTS